MDFDELLWQASFEELKQGYVCHEHSYICLICGETYEDGVIYQIDNQLVTAQKAIQKHILYIHKGTFSFLLELDKKMTGVSEQQKRILTLIYDGNTDDEIAKILSLSSSTIRNHRFYLREKEKQARLFAVIMDLVSEKIPKKQKMVTPHRTTPIIDERYAVTIAEEEKFIACYFDANGSIKSFPSKEKRILVILRHIMKRFDSSTEYSESQINMILKPIYEDYALLRRYLIEYGFMDRVPDGSRYWIKHK